MIYQAALKLGTPSSIKARGGNAVGEKGPQSITPLFSVHFLRKSRLLALPWCSTLGHQNTSDSHIIKTLLQLQKRATWGWRYGSGAKSICCSCREHRFSSHRLDGSSQPSGNLGSQGASVFYPCSQQAQTWCMCVLAGKHSYT